MSETARSLLRVLVASYFLVVALGLVPGTDFSVLEHLTGPSIITGLATSAAVFLLAFMVMIGMQTRLAALLLGLMTVFAAFLSMAHPDASLDIGAFWRDLALIAALMLTYAEPIAAPKSIGPGRHDPAMRIRPDAAGRPAPALPLFASARARMHARFADRAKVTDLAAVREQAGRNVDLRAPLDRSQIEGVFNEDRAIVRGH